MQDAARSAGRYWDEYARLHISASGSNTNRAEWLGHPEVAQFHANLCGGLDLGTWLIKNYLEARSPGRCAGIGSGVAAFELGLLQAGAIEQLDLFDASAVSLAKAEHMAAQMGLAQRITTHMVDANELVLDQGAYDLICCISSLHHIARLDHVLTQARDALTATGVLFSREYIGPNRFRFAETDIWFARRLYEALDRELCRFPDLPIPDPDEVARVDPTEAVNSSQIIETVKTLFRQVDVMPMAGTLPFIIWPGLDHNALYETPKGWNFVRILLELDLAMVRSGRVPSYFAALVAHNRPR